MKDGLARLLPILPKCTGKENPLLFTDVAVDNEGEEFTYDVEGENPDTSRKWLYKKKRRENWYTL